MRIQFYFADRLYSMIIYIIDRLHMQKKNSSLRAVFEVISCLIKQDRIRFASFYHALNH